MCFIRQKRRVLIFLGTLIFNFSSHALSFTESVKKAAFSKNVWIPSASALVFAVTGQDGKISDWASRKRPLFHSVENASSYSDDIAFKYLPFINLVNKGVSQYQNKHNPNYFIHYSSFIFAPAITYLVSRIIKDSSGRIRPDSSNDLSFPSGHTSLSSSFSEEFYYSSRQVYSESWANGMYYFNEGLVGSVAWARLEAKKHHLTDVLVGYSLGKFLSHFLHNYFFYKSDQMKVTLDYQPNLYTIGKLSWSY